MSTDRWMRASDRDRDKTAEVLRDAYAVGRLSSDEFDERCVAAYSARTLGELEDLTADLPASPAGNLPADTVDRRDVARRSTRCAYARMVCTCLLILVSGLAGHVYPAAVVVIAVVSVVLVLLCAGRGAGAERSRRGGRRWL